jgi:LysM domain-containing protein
MPVNDDVARKQAEQAAQRIRTEAAALRADMATAKIAAAKKDAEVQELRRQMAEFMQAETQRQQKGDERVAELTMLRTERDRLQKEKTDLQAQLANPNRQVASESPASQNKMKAMDQALALLARELSQVKQMLAKNQPKTKGKKDAELMPSGATDESAPMIQPAVMEHVPDPPRADDSSVRHIVQPEETLFGIARDYGISVQQLKKANGLKGEAVKVGRRLIIPVSQ